MSKCQTAHRNLRQSPSASADGTRHTEPFWGASSSLEELALQARPGCWDHAAQRCCAVRLWPRWIASTLSAAAAAPILTARLLLVVMRVCGPKTKPLASTHLSGSSSARHAAPLRTPRPARTSRLTPTETPVRDLAATACGLAVRPVPLERWPICLRPHCALSMAPRTTADATNVYVYYCTTAQDEASPGCTRCATGGRIARKLDSQG